MCGTDGLSYSKRLSGGRRFNEAEVRPLKNGRVPIKGRGSRGYCIGLDCKIGAPEEGEYG